jgi:hypothetical protein
LVPEDRPGADAGAVRLLDAVVQYVLKKIEIRAHRGTVPKDAGGVGKGNRLLRFGGIANGRARRSA